MHLCAGLKEGGKDTCQVRNNLYLRGLSRVLGQKIGDIWNLKQSIRHIKLKHFVSIYILIKTLYELLYVLHSNNT